VLYVADVPMPVPAAGEVLVEVRAAGINPGEAAIRSGVMHGSLPATFPSGQGSDVAGVVSATGEGVTDLSVGDEVLGYSWRRSSHAVSAAAGGVGTVVVQLLAARGVRVLGIASPANAEWLAAHGARQVDYGDRLGERSCSSRADGGSRPSALQTGTGPAGCHRDHPRRPRPP
jgi:NADPH:quinone reductase-like Zn-dependent oxidoreductase